MSDKDYKSVIFVTTPGIANQFPYSPQSKHINMQQITICDEEELNNSGLIRSYDGKFIEDNYYIEHPFMKGTYIMLDNVSDLETNIKKDRDEQISQIVGILGATYCRSYLCETEYENKKIWGKLVGNRGLFRGNGSVEAKEENDKRKKYHLNTLLLKEIIPM